MYFGSNGTVTEKLRPTKNHKTTGVWKEVSFKGDQINDEKRLLVIATLGKSEHAQDRTTMDTPWTGIAFATSCMFVIAATVGIIYKRKCYEVPKSFFKEEEESTVNYKSNDGGNVNVVAVTDNEYYGGGEPGEVHVKGWQYLSQLTQIL